MTAGEAQTPTPDYSQLLSELKPRMMFEVTEQNLASYLGNHPELFALPEGFEAPRVTFLDGFVEVGALTTLLFIPTRVRVTMEPEVVRGRLHLKVHAIHAGAIPLPASFHRGTADTIARVINEILDRNEVQLISVCSVRGLIRIFAQAGPVARAPQQEP